MNSLFGHLVDKLGSNTVIDPISREDALWKLINFFTKSNLCELSSFAENNHNMLSEADMAHYFRNHLEDSKAFDRILTVMLRLGDKSNFTNNVLQHLREYQAKHNALPHSFEQAKIRNTYLKLKHASKAKGITVSEKSAEYLLFLLKSSKMWPEIIDLSESY